MRQQDTGGAVGRIASAVVVWSSCISVVSAQCDASSSNLFTSCGIPRNSMIGIIAGGAVLIILSAIYSTCLWRRRQRNRVRLSNDPYDALRIRSSNVLKSYRAPAPGGYPVDHQATPPAPPPVHTPQYPPRGYDTYYNQLRSQMVPPSSVRTIPPSTAPVSPMSMRAPSGISSRPISSFDTIPLSLRASMHRDDSATFVPPSPSSLLPVSPHSTQRNVAESPLLPPPSSLPHRSPPSSAASLPPINPAPPMALASMHTGTSYNNIDEPPPAYTPI